MKYCALFVVSFFLTLFGALQIPALQKGVERHLLAYLQKELGIEVQGDVRFRAFPFELDLDQVIFDPQGKAVFKAESLTLGLGHFFLQLDETIDFQGQFWLSLSGGWNLSIEQDGEWGLFEAVGTFSDWKVQWEKPEYGSAIAYFSLDWKDGEARFSSCEAAGSFLNRPFTLIGTGLVQHPLVEFRLMAAESDPFAGEANLVLYRFGPAWEGTLEVKGDIKGEASISIVEGQLIALKEGHFSLGESCGSLEAELDLPRRELIATSTLATDSLPFFTSASGDLLAKTSFSSSLDKNFFPVSPHAELELYCHRLEIGPATLVDGEGIFSFIEENGIPRWNIKGDLSKFFIGEETFHQTTFLSAGRVGELSPFSFRTGREEEEFVVRGEFSPSREGLRLFFESIDGTLFDLPFGLKETGFLSFHADGWRLDRLHIQLGETSMNWQGKGNDGEMVVQGKISSTAMQELSSFVKGSLDGTVDIRGPWSDLEGILSVQVKQAVLPTLNVPLSPLDGSLNIRVKDEVAFFKGDFKGTSDEMIAGEGHIRLDAPFFLDSQITFNGEMAPFLAMILPDTTSASGNGIGTFFLSGSFSEPQLIGQLSLKGGSYEDLMTGMICQRLEGDFRFENKEILLDNLKAFDKQGNGIEGSGKMVFADDLPFTLNLDSKAAQILNLDYAIGRASGQVVLSGTREGGKLSGNLTIDEMSIHLPEKTPIRFQTLDVIYEKIHPVEEKKPWRMEWDLHLDVPNPVEIVGTAFSSVWKGDFDLQGSTEAPLVFGKGKLVDATFSFNSKVFHSNEGMILFQGEPSTKSSFYITAKQEIDDLKIDILLKGPLNSPELSFRSKPVKSQREILSYLLFNRGLGEISPYEGEELTQSIIKLDSTTTSSDKSLLERLKSGLGIDRLEISGEKESNPDNVSLEVGKYLSPQLYFSLKKSVADGPNQAFIEAKLPHHFKAQAEVGDDAEGKFMLKWEHDY